MIEITNKLRGPVQIIIRSRLKSCAFTCLNIPGIGSGKNIYNLADERTTEYVKRAEKDGLITTKYVKEGE